MARRAPKPRTAVPRSVSRAAVEGVLGARFRLERPLGTGASATAWLAVDLQRGDRCVVKAVALAGDDARASDRFRREAEALQSVAHPNVVRLRGVVVAPERGLACLVTDHASGPTLREMSGRGALPEKDLLDLLVGCARALDALHRAGLVHRDLQPGNVTRPRSRRRSSRP
jgi:serine/threonine protein kinase